MISVAKIAGRSPHPVPKPPYTMMLSPMAGGLQPVGLKYFMLHLTKPLEQSISLHRCLLGWYLVTIGCV